MENNRIRNVIVMIERGSIFAAVSALNDMISDSTCEIEYAQKCRFYVCNRCHTALNETSRFCPNCGRKNTLNEEDEQ